MKITLKRLFVALSILAGVTVVGVLGYWLIFDWELFDAIYMTVITVGQVGYGEIGEMTTASRIFTIGLIMAGIAGFAFTLAAFVDVLVQFNLRSLLERRRMDKQLSELRDHSVIAGLGRVGGVVARMLAENDQPFVVIDTSEEAAEQAREAGWAFVHGDATEENVLELAGIERAGSLVSTLDSDAENLFVTVTARALNPSIFIVARSTHETSEAKLLKAGADRVLTPNVIGGRRMATMILHPVVADYLDLVAHGDGVEFRLQEIEIPEDSRLDGLTIAGAAIRETTGAYVLAIRHNDGTVDTNPSPDSPLRSGQRLVVLGTQDQVATFATNCALCSLD